MDISQAIISKSNSTLNKLAFQRDVSQEYVHKNNHKYNILIDITSIYIYNANITLNKSAFQRDISPAYVHKMNHKCDILIYISLTYVCNANTTFKTRHSNGCKSKISPQGKFQTY